MGGGRYGVEPGRGLQGRPGGLVWGLGKSLVAEPLAGGSARRGRWLASLVIGLPASRGTLAYFRTTFPGQAA